jgi:uncharacterized protein (DUF697 family)
LEKTVLELRTKNEEVRAMTQQLWQAAKLASGGELAASIAHELNNPLATVVLRIESMLARTPETDPRRRALEIVDQEAKRMGELVANLLQFSRRGDGQISTVDIALERIMEPFFRTKEEGKGTGLGLAICRRVIQEGQPYPFRLPSTSDETAAAVSDNLLRSVAAQTERFQGLFDDLVLVDLTPVEEGFADPHYGDPFLKEVILKSLPEAFRQSLLTLEKATKTLQDYYSREALPYILGYSSLAATAGAIPMPWIDLLILPGIQTQMIYHLARLYGQPLSGERFLELSGTLGMGIALRQAIRELVKFIPFVGSLAGATMAASATFALGKAFCYYYGAVHQGHVPKAEDLKKYYLEQLALARHALETNVKRRSVISFVLWVYAILCPRRWWQ